MIRIKDSFLHTFTRLDLQLFLHFSHLHTFHRPVWSAFPSINPIKALLFWSLYCCHLDIISHVQLFCDPMDYILYRLFCPFNCSIQLSTLSFYLYNFSRAFSMLFTIYFFKHIFCSLFLIQPLLSSNFKIDILKIKLVLLLLSFCVPNPPFALPSQAFIYSVDVSLDVLKET